VDEAFLTAKVNSPKAAPTILAIGAAVWKAFAAWGNIDFILSIREESFRMIFQFLLNYGWWILIVVGIAWALQAHENPEGYARVHWGMVTTVGILAFIFGVLLTVYSTGSVPNIVEAYGTDGQNCFATLDTSRLTKFKDTYHIFLVCGLNDPRIDRFEDERIARSGPFNIAPGGVNIIAPFGRLADAIQELMKSSKPPNTVTISVWHTSILMPKDADPSEIKRLSDVPKHGGKILETGYF
jgi:hypothetical protein